MNIHVDNAETVEPATETPTLLLAIDQLTRVSYLVEAIFMAAFDIGDMQKTNAIQHVVISIQGEIEKLEETLEAIKTGEDA